MQISRIVMYASFGAWTIATRLPVPETRTAWSNADVICLCRSTRSVGAVGSVVVVVVAFVVVVASVAFVAWMLHISFFVFGGVFGGVF